MMFTYLTNRTLDKMMVMVANTPHRTASMTMETSMLHSVPAGCCSAAAVRDSSAWSSMV